MEALQGGMVVPRRIVWVIAGLEALISWDVLARRTGLLPFIGRNELIVAMSAVAFYQWQKEYRARTFLTDEEKNRLRLLKISLSLEDLTLEP